MSQSRISDMISDPFSVSLATGTICTIVTRSPSQDLGESLALTTITTGITWFGMKLASYVGLSYLVPPAIILAVVTDRRFQQRYQREQQRFATVCGNCRPGAFGPTGSIVYACERCGGQPNSTLEPLSHNEQAYYDLRRALVVDSTTDSNDARRIFLENIVDACQRQDLTQFNRVNHSCRNKGILWFDNITLQLSECRRNLLADIDAKS